MTPFVKADSLAVDGVAHGFFGRAGGVSKGLFESLNCGLGSADAIDDARENRARAARALGCDPARLLTLHQVHSARAVVVDAPFGAARPEADGFATREKGLLLGVLAADCMPLLFADVEAGVVGAAHAGWRGALAGVIEATVDAMASIGARPARVRAALGPCLRPPDFQVGADVLAAFSGKYPSADRFFGPDAEPGRFQLDLAGFARWRLAESGVAAFGDVGVSTLARAGDYFSYRASRRANEPDYGRNLSAIALL